MIKKPRLLKRDGVFLFYKMIKSTMKNKNTSKIRREKRGDTGKIKMPAKDHAECLQYAIMMHQQGHLIKAEGIYKRILQLQPNYFEVLHHLGTLFLQQQKYKAAVDIYEKALENNSTQPFSLNNYALALHEIKRYNDAITYFDKAIAIYPVFPEAYFNRGNSFLMVKEYSKAILSYNKALEYRPDYTDAYSNQGAAYLGNEQFEHALLCYDKAIRLKPDFYGAYLNRGVIHRDLKQYEDALHNFKKAILLKPKYAEAYVNIALVFKESGRYDDAIINLDKAIYNNPECAEAYYNKGNILREIRKYDDAIVCYDIAIALNPEDESWYLARLHTNMYICDWSTYTESIKKIKYNYNHHKIALTPFPLLALIDSPSTHKEVANNYVETKYKEKKDISDIRRHPKHLKIRIGYYSQDLKNHAVTSLLIEMLELHDREKFEIYAFSFTSGIQDEMSQRIKITVDQFFDVNHMSDKDVVMLSRKHEIDIAIDLSGFTRGCRTGIFALRASPIQVNYLGYPGTMGAEYIDYLIADKIVVPEIEQQHYTEKLAYLPNSYMVNSKRLISDNAIDREPHGLPKTGIIFCCFNNNYKITPESFDCWMRILKQVPGSVLWLLESHPKAAGNLRQEATRRGVESERLIFAKRLLRHSDHLARYRLADLFLDTLPFNAHTTAGDALWAGLPVLTCMGESFAGRVAASLLNALHLPELITTTYDEYEALAIELAKTPNKLNTIKHKLSQNRLTTPLFDTPLFTKHIEQAYTEMYERYQENLSPEHLYIKNKGGNKGNKIATLESKDSSIDNSHQGKIVLRKEAEISIDNKKYTVASLSDNAKALLSYLQFADNEITRLKTILAVTKAARGSYLEALKAEMLQKSIINKR